MRYLFGMLCLGVVLAVAGCGSMQVMNGYEGETLPASKVATVEMGLGAYVASIDGRHLKYTCSAENNSNSIMHKVGCKLALLPGKHELGVGYSMTAGMGAYNGVSVSETTSLKYLAIVQYDFKAGKHYILYGMAPPFKVSLEDPEHKGIIELKPIRYEKIQ